MLTWLGYIDGKCDTSIHGIHGSVMGYVLTCSNLTNRGLALFGSPDVTIWRPFFVVNFTISRHTQFRWILAAKIIWNPNLVGGLVAIFIFPYIGNNHPNWLIFFRGVETTNQELVAAYGKAHWDPLSHLVESFDWGQTLPFFTRNLRSVGVSAVTGAGALLLRRCRIATVILGLP